MKVILCADDFALSPGVSDGIIKLIIEGRLSATSALVTTEIWPHYADRLSRLRELVGVGLHLNLTSGVPLGRMPCLAPNGRFPAIGTLIGLAFTRQLDRVEIDAEIDRQFERFIRYHGHAPDFVDGHEHIHVLPTIRQSLFRKIASDFDRSQLLVRDPSDRVASIAARGTAVVKAMAIRGLATGFRRAAVAANALTNGSFAGFAAFDDRCGFPEFERFLLYPQDRHLVMCHPGLPDKPGVFVPHAQRRFEEFAYLGQRPSLSNLIWHPSRLATRQSTMSIFHL